jgi:hypothetical protein
MKSTQRRLSGAWRNQTSPLAAPAALDDLRAETLRRLREIVAEQLPGEGFSLVVWPDGPDGPIDHVGNRSRQDADGAMRTLLRRWGQ